MGLALAFGGGVALIHLGAPLPPAPLLLAALLLPIYASIRPGSPSIAPRSGPAVRTPPSPLRISAALCAALAAGVLHGTAWERGRLRDCRLALVDGAPLELSGRVESSPVRGRLVLRVDRGLGAGCGGAVRVVLPRPQGGQATTGGGEGEGEGADEGGLRPGAGLIATGTWRRTSATPHAPEYAGELVAVEVRRSDDDQRSGELLLRRRADIEGRLLRLYPERHGVVAALILARKEGLGPGLREAFARSGTAHLLAISGFHVGVVAALLLGLVRALGVGARPAGAVAALAVWGYVLFIGAPDAAARAALILTLLALGTLMGRYLARAGALATAFLILLVHDAGALARPGFQLSFCGVAGLVLLARPLEVRLARVLPGARLRSLRSAVAAGVAATLATSPVVAWHFDQVSVVGIPVTLVTTPLVAAAIPGAFASLAADLLHPSAGAFLAGGTDVALALLIRVTEGAADLPFAVVWIPRSWVLAGAAGAALALALLSGIRRVGRAVRGTVALCGAGVAVLLLPLGERVATRGSVELHFLDVGQGDAVLVRSPGGRWILVDAGPPRGLGAGGDPAVLRALRRRGVRRIEALVLSHPHLDHIGGASAVIGAMPVGVVVDPGMVMGTGAFVDVLHAAEQAGLGWHGARQGDVWDFDGLDLRVLHSLDGIPPAEGGDVVNENSVVLLVSFGAFSAMLTGDAPVSVEEVAVRDSGPIDVLKVGHHGSHTSTSAAFLRQARPGVAVISVGRQNRYGHPHEPVLARLSEAGSDLYRTDRDGTVRVTARRDGSYAVHAERRR